MTRADPKSGMPKAKRRWFQFSLATLLLAMTVIALWLGAWTERARRQKRAVETITRLGGTVFYSYQAVTNPKDEIPPGPAWLRDFLGIDYLDHVIVATVVGNPVTDADLEALRGVPQLERLTLGDSNEITDAGLACLEDLHRLEWLELHGSRITDDGLAHLEDLHRLEYLDLNGVGITDAGLVHLRPLRQLKSLRLHCKITDAGMDQLAPLTALMHLRSSGTPGDPAKAKTMEAIPMPTAMDFVDTPLVDVCDYLGDFHKVKLTIDAAALKGVGIDKSAGVTYRAGKKRIDLGEALHALLDPLGLDWHVAPHGIAITAKAAVAERHAGVLRLQKALPNLKDVLVDW